MSWRRKQGWLVPAVLVAAAVVGYLVGLLIRQWDADSSPWTVAGQVTAAALVAMAAVRRNIRQVQLLKADPQGYVQDRRLAEDNRLLPGWLLAGNLLIAGMFVAVLLLKPQQGDGYALEGILLLAEVVLWGVLLWGWLAVRREVESTGRHSTATGRGRVARSRALLDRPYSEARQLLELALADHRVYRLLAETGRTLWLGTGQKNTITLILQVELVSTGQGTELHAVSFPLDRFASNTAGRGGHALVVLLDAVADRAAGLPGPPVRHSPPATG
ncbi:hypothetical protein LJ754_12810 [Arthrobacter sp. zg-Y40]|uniref:hypothetical protein n=1 Tax=Arthrobacter sp. zg-Y40 TaxID=2886939 RepID=UPI001D15CCFA|nr:hypothetical protein [Arthrobacter sp. zg-Y40]MCC3280033.1 hypothetical protein [Arthrobacter sp. zg-Y40]